MIFFKILFATTSFGALFFYFSDFYMFWAFSESSKDVNLLLLCTLLFIGVLLFREFIKSHMWMFSYFLVFVVCVFQFSHSDFHVNKIQISPKCIVYVTSHDYGAFSTYSFMKV